MKHRNKVDLPKRPICLIHTDVAETFKRIRKEQAAEAKKTKAKVLDLSGNRVKRAAGARGK